MRLLILLFCLLPLFGYTQKAWEVVREDDITYVVDGAGQRTAVNATQIAELVSVKEDELKKVSDREVLLRELAALEFRRVVLSDELQTLKGLLQQIKSTKIED